MNQFHFQKGEFVKREYFGHVAIGQILMCYIDYNEKKYRIKWDDGEENDMDEDHAKLVLKKGLVCLK